MHHELTYTRLIECVAVENNTSSALDTSNSDALASVSDVAKYDRLPDFVKAISPQLSSDDIDYLVRKGALDVPQAELLDAIIRSYFQYFHWFMPLLDQHVLLSCTGGHWRPGMPTISILVLQAVMFIGVTFVDEQHLHKGGFESRRAARRSFYERVRLLYELDVEENRIPIIQATLLMSFWNETPGDNKGGWHFLGIAISLALTIGLHRKQTFSNPSVKKHLSKRIWWSCYMRDRMLALGMSRPLRINDVDFSTPLLELEDFELQNNTPDSVLHQVLEPECQQSLAEMCITMAKLCVQIGMVINLHYSILPSDSYDHSVEDPTGRTTPILYLRSEPRELELVRRCDQSLQGWFDNRPISAIFQPPRSKDIVESAAVVMAHQAFLQVCFCGTLSALHRPQVYLDKPDAKNVIQREESRERSRSRVEEATTEMAKINYHIHKLHLGYSLPPTAATLEIPILITHLKHIQSKENRNLETCLQSILYCVKVWEEMQDLYVGVDLVLKFAADLIKRANINMVVGENMKVAGVCYRDRQYHLRNTESCEPGSNPDPSDTNGRYHDQDVASFHTLYSSENTPCTTKTTVCSQHTDDTIPSPSKVNWGFCDDILLADNPDLEAIFQLMVDFDNLDELAPEL
ncbi:hypothetical protein AYL99_10564 [Fonsecaea erecta]|uniref:Xylanolytic transcriptional activator regulatory domain-containing protein n=1 Tax=Fonsecaea erecta TaxID=1367422 RepID=A0A178Z7X4_9EURO|nr:hypothetical protein AYL99_10564 [Fonsecaea erecta]OAP55591.1 hypothetical protein AYL99_10564 [Fonsecaea erecta]